MLLKTEVDIVHVDSVDDNKAYQLCFVGDIESAFETAFKISANNNGVVVYEDNSYSINCDFVYALCDELVGRHIRTVSRKELAVVRNTKELIYVRP